jgi:hypothetical protein
MVSAVTQPSAIPARRTGSVPSPARFGAVPEKAVKVAHLQTAKGIQKLFSWAKSDIRVGGLSLEDMAGRLLTLIGIYIPQGYFAIKDEKHPWETNGRNAVVWLMTLALTSMTKSENYGVNTLLLNPIMKQKGSATPWLPFMKRILDPFRMDVDYLDILEHAGIALSKDEKRLAGEGKKALWASSWLDVNKLEKIQNHYKTLQQKVADKVANKEALSKVDKRMLEVDKRMLEAIPSFFKRINAFNFVSTALITAATVYFIGGVAMRIVNKVFSPLDKDYEGPNAKKKLPEPAAHSGGAMVPSAFPIRQNPLAALNYGYHNRFAQSGSQGGPN